MALIVQKYGGTSVADIQRIRNVADRVLRTKQKGHDVVVVLSARAGDTDRLIQLAKEMSPRPDPRELDMLVSTGEQITIALFCMAVKDRGYDAISMTGYQAGILTDDHFGSARISSINSEAIMNHLKQGRIVAVAGFQGVDPEGNITTLGRGGSDTTAVAIAAALKADRCEIYTDVDGVYTTDPSVYSKARKLKKISYEEMLEMASLGAKVLHFRSVEFGMKYKVPIYVASSFEDVPGTFVTEEDEEMEKVVVSGVTYTKNVARVTINDVPDVPGMAAAIFKPLADAGINVDMIIQGSSGIPGRASISFTVPEDRYGETMEIVRTVSEKIGAGKVHGDNQISKVSIVGLGMRSHCGVAEKMFSTLASQNINIQMISTSEIKISCVIDSKYTELAVRMLHDAFELDKDPNGVFQVKEEILPKEVVR